MSCTWQSAGGCRGVGAREGSFRRPRRQPAEGNPRRRSLTRTDGGRVGTALLRREDLRGDSPRVRARVPRAGCRRSPDGGMWATSGFFGLKGREGLARRGPSGVLPGANQATLPGRTLRTPRELSPRQAGEAGRGRVVWTCELGTNGSPLFPCDPLENPGLRRGGKGARWRGRAAAGEKEGPAALAWVAGRGG